MSTIDKKGLFLIIQYCREFVKHLFIKFRLQLAVISLFILLTVIFTYPVAFSADAVPGHGDVSFYLWDIWWFKMAAASFSSPFWTPYLFHPSGLSLAFSTITPLNGIISVPLQFIFGLIITYNILWLFSFFLAGYGTFLLVHYFTNDNYASFISGLIFMFSPYHFAHALGHLSLISIGWIPLYILYLFKTIREAHYKNGFIAAIFLILTGISDNTYLFYVVSFTILLLVYYLVMEREILLKKSVIKRFILMGITFGIGFFPFIYPLLSEFRTSTFNHFGFAGTAAYSADLVSFLLPSQLHPVFGKIVDPLYTNITGGIAEYTIFVGYTVLVLAIFAIIKVKTREIRFWGISVLVFFTLSLGPVLHLNGILTGTYEGIRVAVPLPYYLIMQIPFISFARAPVRWDVMIMLSLSVLAGYGMTYIFTKYRKKTLLEGIPGFSMNVVLATVFSALILFEFLAIPYPMTNVPIPDIYQSIKDDPGNFAVMEIPGFVHPDYMYYQTLHEKKLITGYAHVPDSSLKFIQNNPVIRNLLMFNQDPAKKQVEQRDIIDQDRQGLSVLNHYDIRYIIVHKNDLTGEQNSFINTLAEKYFEPGMIIVNDSNFSVYKLPQITEQPFTSLDSGWSDPEVWDGIPTRWMTDRASIIIYSPVNQTATLSLNTLSFYRPRSLIISGQNISSEKVSIPTTHFISISKPIMLYKGENMLQLIPDTCEKPISLPGLNNKDPRCISIAIQSVKVTLN
jgi:hypothetical protein